MPIVPFSRASAGLGQKGDSPVPPPMDWTLIAAAQMHSEGRLIDPNKYARLPASENVEDRRGMNQPEGDAVDEATETAALRNVRSVTNRMSKRNEPMEEIK